jgi:hypothetical protein
MDAIQELTQINFVYVFISVFVILIGIKAIVSLFEWVIDKLGLETKWMRKRREERELLFQTSQNLIVLQEQHKLTLDNDTFENTGKSRVFERRTSRVLY